MEKYLPVTKHRKEKQNMTKERTEELLIKKGFFKETSNGIKILGKGELTKKLTVKANKFSASAKKAIEDLGGTAEVI